MTNPSREFLDGMAVLRACGNVSRLVYLELMQHMEEKWPDRGWIVQYQALKDFYAALDKQLMERGEGMTFREVAGKINSEPYKKMSPAGTAPNRAQERNGAC